MDIDTNRSTALDNNLYSLLNSINAPTERATSRI